MHKEDLFQWPFTSQSTSRTLCSYYDYLMVMIDDDDDDDAFSAS